jgi:hypothetical protein
LTSAQQTSQPITQAAQSSTVAVALAAAAALTLPAASTQSQSAAPVAPVNGFNPGKFSQTPGISATTTATSASQFAASSAPNAKNGNTGDSASSASTTQASGQPGQHAPTDGTQTIAVTAKDSAPVAAQDNALAVHAASQQSAATHAVSSGATAGAGNGTREAASLHAAESSAPEQTVTQSINTARVIQSMSESEMRVGMHSSEFGDISIRTSVSQQQLMTQISVAHSDLGTAISAHIPSMQEKFSNDFGLHASIEVSHGGADLAGERQQPSQQDQRTFVRSAGAGTAMTAENEVFALRAPLAASDGVRLDIRA